MPPSPVNESLKQMSTASVCFFCLCIFKVVTLRQVGAYKQGPTSTSPIPGSRSSRLSVKAPFLARAKATWTHQPLGCTAKLMDLSRGQWAAQAFGVNVLKPKGGQPLARTATMCDKQGHQQEGKGKRREQGTGDLNGT